jgi:hypothetical protein
MSVRDILVSAVLGVAGSVLASIVWEGLGWWSAIFLLGLPVAYFSVTQAILAFGLGVSWISGTWHRSGLEARLIRDSTTLFRFQTITGRTSLNRADVESAIKERASVKGCKFQILLMHPKSPHLAKFCASEGSDPIRTAEKIVESTKTLRGFHTNVEVRWYRSYPVWRFAGIDDREGHLGYFTSGRKGYEGRRLRLVPRGRNALLLPVSRQFEEDWSRAYAPKPGDLD